MNSTALHRVYHLTFGGKRVCFIYASTSKRLPSVCPLSLVAQTILDPITGELQFIVFDQRYKDIAYDEYLKIKTDCYDDKAYRKICNMSHVRFLEYVSMFQVVNNDRVNPVYRELDEVQLFDFKD